jgi:membrane-associated protein
MTLMAFLMMIFDFFLHIDKHLAVIIADYGTLTYAILFGVIFMETGFVVTPFLPGDSLLFAAGVFAASGSFQVVLLWLILVVAAFLGDTANYWIGHFIGPKAFEMNSRLLKKEHLDKAHAFYEKHGGKAIVLARFVPIVRTFAPFVAGVAKMSYRQFISYNIIGGVVWVSLFVFAGYFFGNLPLVKNNFHYVMVVIVLISLVPIVWERLASKRG